MRLGDLNAQTRWVLDRPGVAAAIVVHVVLTRSEARLADGITVVATGGAVALRSSADTDAVATADGTSVKAGGTGIGVLQTAADEGILSIGVDSNQNHLHPGKVLTSVVKNVDGAVYDAFRAGPAVQPGTRVMDLKSGGVSLAMDDNNKPLMTEAVAKAVADASARIASGEVKVHDYMSDNSCPAQ